MSNPSGYRYTCICQQNKLIVHMWSHYMIEKLLMFYKNLHTGYLFFSIMKSRAFLTRILSHIRKTHGIWIMLYKYLKIELKPSLELRCAYCWGFGKHHCSCLLPEWWIFTMHYVSIIEIYLKNCIKTIFSQANKDKVYPTRALVLTLDRIACT